MQYCHFQFCIFNCLHVPSRSQSFRVVKAKNGVDECRGEVASALASLDDELRDGGEGFQHMFGFPHVDEAHGCTDNSGGVCFAEAREFA